MTRGPLDRPEELIRPLYGYVAYRIGHGPHAEDVTSETFERALRYRDAYDRRRGEPLAWLVGIARRTIADHLRTREGEVPVHDIVQLAVPHDIEEETVRRLSVRDAVARLAPRDRELIALRYGADLTARQIGEQLELATNAVEVALHRALGRLRHSLSEDDGGTPETSAKNEAQVKI